jgi:branched-chain amino acid aminotransferase
VASTGRHALRQCSVFTPSAAQSAPEVGAAGLDWANLGFDFRPTAGFLRYTYKNGRWDEGVLETEPYLKVHVMSATIHYGQAVYEGAKAHHCADGKVRLWNIAANAKRMVRGCERMMMPPVPPAMFVDACERAVRANIAFVPPHGTGGSMYLRPYIFGHGPQLGLAPAPEFSFCVLAMPVSSYYGDRGLQPIDALVVEDADRAAPLGVGNVKASGNYGGDIQVTMEARAQGFPTVLYLDAKTHTHVEEFSVSNFIGIKRDGGSATGGKPLYVTPDSDSVLRSTTNTMLMDIAAKELGCAVERRPIHIDELGEFDEVAGCGTAVVMMGVNSLTMQGSGVRHAYDAALPTITALYEHYRAVQFGESDDPNGWGTAVDLSACSAAGDAGAGTSGGRSAPRAAAAAEAGVGATHGRAPIRCLSRAVDFDAAAEAAVDVEADLARVTAEELIQRPLERRPSSRSKSAKSARAAYSTRAAGRRSFSTDSATSSASAAAAEALSSSACEIGERGATESASADSVDHAAAAAARLARTASEREEIDGQDFQMDPTLAYRDDRNRMSPLASLRMAGTEPNVFSKFQVLAQQHNAVNLASGYPNYPIPQFVKEAGVRGIMEDHNQYTRPAGHPELVAAVQEVYEPRFERFLDSETEIAVVGGATNAIFSAVMALVDPGDEVVCVEPYFECVASSCLRCACTVLPARAHACFRPSSSPFSFSFSSTCTARRRSQRTSWERRQSACRCALTGRRRAAIGRSTLRSSTPRCQTARRSVRFLLFALSSFVCSSILLFALSPLCSPRAIRLTQMLVLNTPHNPTGKVFSREELIGISEVVMRYPNVTVLSDEVYEFMTFDGIQHERIATVPGMWERTLSVYSAGKTFSATGWRVGYVVGPQPLITPLVRVHQASNFCTPSALQIAIAIALRQVRRSLALRRRQRCAANVLGTFDATNRERSLRRSERRARVYRLANRAHPRLAPSSPFPPPPPLNTASVCQAERDDYWSTLSTFLQAKRDRLCKLLRLANLAPIVPQVSFYLPLLFTVTFTRFMLTI